MKKNITDKNMEKVRDINRISAPGNIISSKRTTEKSNDVSCIYNGQNHGVGSTILNENGREYECSSDGTWQIKKK